jgi:acyl transferase domain-containing protein
VEIDWRGFHGGVVRRRVPLPTYPFEGQRYWVERATGEAVVRKDRGNKRPDLGEWFYLPSWKRAAVPPRDAEKRGPWLLFKDESGLGERLAGLLEQAGQQVARVVAGDAFAERAALVYALNPEEPRDYTRLLDALEAKGLAPMSIVHLWGLDEVSRRVQELGFFSLVYLARALGARAQDVRREIAVVTSGVQDVTGEEALRPEQATVLGPCKVIPQEYPGLACRSVDLVAADAAGWDDASAAQLLRELQAGGDDKVVAYRGGRRWVDSHEAWPLPPVAGRPLRLREGGVYLVTGALGGIGLEVAETLAREARARLVLVSRGALPARQEWERWIETHGDGDELARRLRRLRALEAHGAELLPLQADAADLEQMKKVVAEAEARFGPLNGAVHAVGVERAFQSIAETGPAEAQVQFRPRLRAAAVLEQALAGRTLDFCLLISSLSAVVGGRGSVAYTAAHAFLDAFAARQNRVSSVPWLSVNWDRWNTWRETPEQPVEGEAGFFMTPAEAGEALRRLLARDGFTQVVVSTGDLHGRIDRWIRQIQAAEPAKAEGGARSTLYARPELAEALVAPRTETEKVLAEIWRDALGLAEVGVNDDYFELGGDSVIGLKIVAKANEAGLRMTGRHIFEHHTIGQLASVLAGAARPPETAAENAAPAPAPAETTAFPGARLGSKDLEAFLAQLEGGGATSPK